jgi:metallo-beta-lactamase class B
MTRIMRRSGHARRLSLAAGALAMAVAAIVAASAVEPDPPRTCDQCEAWNRPHEPFRVFGNTYYVGVAGLTAILIASRDGLILLDGDLPQSASLIAQGIRKLGFRIEDVRLIVNSHAHFDHAGGIAALQRASGAVVAASAPSAQALEQGEPSKDDPQYGYGRPQTGFAPVPAVRVVADNETLRVGELAITAHFTPGHTPGSTTWTWRSCEASRCLDIVYADSLNAISAPGFMFSGDRAHPDRVPRFRRSIALLEELPCDVLLSPHPESFDMEEKLQRIRPPPGANPFVDAQACRHYASGARRKLEQRLAQEAAARGRSPA